MSEVRRNFLVGVFMIVGLGVLGFLMVMFGETPSWLGGAEYPLRIRTQQISGVMEGTPVFLNGIKVGRVTDFKFVDMNAPDRGVDVIARIQKTFRIPRGATASMIAPTLGMGRGRIDVKAEGAGLPPVGEDEYILGQMGNPFADLLPETMMGSLESTVVKIGNFAAELTPVAQDLHELFKKTPIAEADSPVAVARGVTSNLYTVVQRTDQVLKHVDEVIGDPAVRSNLRLGIDNLVAMTADGRATFADLRETSANLKADSARISGKLERAIDNADGRIAQLADAAMPVLDSTARTSANLRTISDNLVAGKGTAGLLLTDNRLYEVLVLALQRATDAIDSLRRLLYRFEGQGRIGLNVSTPVGPVNADQKLPQ